MVAHARLAGSKASLASVLAIAHGKGLARAGVNLAVGKVSPDPVGVDGRVGGTNKRKSVDCRCWCRLGQGERWRQR